MATVGPPEALLEVLDAQAVKARNSLFDGARRTLVVIPTQDLHGSDAVRRAIHTDVKDLDHCATVTCVGRA